MTKDIIATETPLYAFECQVTNVVDGDTLDVRMDMGFEVEMSQRIRLNDVDTAEVYGVRHDSEEYEEGKEQSHAVREWIQVGMFDGDEYPFILHSEHYHEGKYGRVVGDIYSKNHERWLTEFLEAGFDL